MLERNRGARRDRTRAIIRRRSLLAERRLINEMSSPSIGRNWMFDGNGKRTLVDGSLCDGSLTSAQLRDIHRYCRRHEGRFNCNDNKCGDCSVGSGNCDYCGVRQEQREKAIAAELRDFIRYEGRQPDDCIDWDVETGME